MADNGNLDRLATLARQMLNGEVVGLEDELGIWRRYAMREMCICFQLDSADPRQHEAGCVFRRHFERAAKAVTQSAP